MSKRQVKVNISTYGSVNKEVGWDFKEVKVEQTRVTVEDVLRSVELGEGRTLLDLVANESGINDSYTILLNGRPLWDSKALKMEIKDEDVVTAMDVLHAIGGG